MPSDRPSPNGRTTGVSPFDDALRASFFRELEKIALSQKFHVSKTRSGRRSMAVTTLLRKEKEGTLYKRASSGGLTTEFVAGPADPSEARRPKRKGELPSKEDCELVNRADGRDYAATVQGPGNTLSIAGTVQSPGSS